MPRNSRNPIEARGRMANFRAKPIAIIDVGKDDLGAYPNPLSLEVQFYIGAQQVKKNYDTRVALEWYLDNIFIPDFIKRALKYFVPSGATSSKDKIANYPKPVQDKMLEESLDEHLKHFGLPQVFPVEMPFSFDGRLIVPGDIAVGYTGLVRKSKPVGYYDMPTPQQITDGVPHFGKVAFFRYDWMLSDEELEKRYKLKAKEKLTSAMAGEKTTTGVASANFEPREKSQSELYESRVRKCDKRSVELFSDYNYFYNSMALVVPTDPKKIIIDVLHNVAPIQIAPYIRRGWYGDMRDFIEMFFEQAITYSSPVFGKEKTQKFVIDWPADKYKSLNSKVAEVLDSLYVRLVSSEHTTVKNAWNLGEVWNPGLCDFPDWEQKSAFGVAGVTLNYKVPDYSLVIGIDVPITLPVRNMSTGLATTLDTESPFLVVFPAGVSKQIPFQAK